jgi:HK97 family phage major capsid protein
MAATTTSNATLTAAQVQKFLIQPLTQSSSFLRVGSPMFVSNGEPIKLPSLTSFGTPTFIAQGSAISEVNAVTSEVELLASSIQAIKVIAKVSDELLRSAVLNVEAAFSTKLVSDVSRILDAAMWNGGTATTGSPVGLCQMTGFTNAGTTAGTALTSTHLFDMQESYMVAQASDASAVWAMSPKTFGLVRKMSDNYGARVLAPSLAAGAPGTLLGNPYVVTTHVPDTALVLYDRDQIAVGMDDRASVKILDQTFADYGLVGISVSARYDVKALNAAAIVKRTLT